MTASHAPKQDKTEKMNAEDYFCHLLNKGYNRELAKLLVGRRFSDAQAEYLNQIIV